MFKITEQIAERLKSRNVYIGSLIARQPTRLYHQAFVETMLNLEKAGIKYKMQNLGGCSDLSYARNVLAAMFMDSGCTDMIWIDDDMAWESSDILRLLASEQDMICGGYRKKLDNYKETDPLAWCCHPFDDRPIHKDETGAIEIPHVGFGFMKTSRKVFETIIEKKPDLPNTICPTTKRHIYRFFHFDGLGVSEDYAFCEMWRSVGGSVWIDPEIDLAHTGEYSFMGRIGGMLEAAATKSVKAA
jgi:hypothetical protein